MRARAVRLSSAPMDVREKTIVRVSWNPIPAPVTCASLARAWRANNTRRTAAAAAEDMYTNRARLSHQTNTFITPRVCFMQSICKFCVSVETLSIRATRTFVPRENQDEIESLKKKKNYDDFVTRFFYFVWTSFDFKRLVLIELQIQFFFFFKHDCWYLRYIKYHTINPTLSDWKIYNKIIFPIYWKTNGSLKPRLDFRYKKNTFGVQFFTQEIILFIFLF
jgi:hypothetical protein